MLKGIFKVFYVLKEGLLQVARDKGMSAAVVAIVTAALIQLAVVMGVTRSLERALVSAKDKFELTLFLSADIQQADRQRVSDLLASDNRIASVGLITKEDALKEFKRDPDIKRMLDALGENPLTDSLTVVLKPEVNGKLDDLVDRLEKDPGVDEVRYGRGEWESVSRLIQSVRLTGSALAGIVFLAALFIISNALSLMLASRRYEIRLLSRLGAPSWIRGGPFILEGLFHGLLGAGGSILFLEISRRILIVITLQSSVLNTAMHLPREDWTLLYMILIVIGSGLGLLGATLALRTPWTRGAR